MPLSTVTATKSLLLSHFKIFGIIHMKMKNNSKKNHASILVHCNGMTLSSVIIIN